MKSNEMLNLYLQKKVNEKENLSSQKVELGLAQDLLQEYKKAVDQFTSAESAMDRASEMLKQAKKVYNELEQKSKELGIDLDSSTRKLGTNLDSFIKSSSKG
jgi:phage shock protein A